MKKMTTVIISLLASATGATILINWNLRSTFTTTVNCGHSVVHWAGISFPPPQWSREGESPNEACVMHALSGTTKM